MKYFIGMAVTLLLSTPVLAAGELEINQSPLTLVLSDQNQARVSSCADFIALRKAGETVDALPGLSDPDGRAAEAALFSCWLQAYTIVKSYYRIDDTHARVWSVTLLDENSPL
ncbi:hypothetical protein [Klebsiella quasipneumoniae]|uniref:hypothetical protein n=1 Tax=Klebsiella quasipneumoniae TaxID=1463165 RepID=UPI000E4788A4|nr:hypothetical protein [Klebsiella quasipneumoniae]MBX8478870.1 hypothetical protein [Klebsiella quasipneumoniae subsp. similipneumoniae]MBX9411991.1 hypothetical protein [Klebsiella quasipneumoniae subsp. similipneumoniae]MBX9418214.1 hypothetical protein [Klebsiella quasipneumoniae subsp. similipneumoniae]